MSYEAYTPPPEIEPNTRKDKFYRTCAARGERAALRENARGKKPNKPGTLRTWASHMKNLGVWKR